METEADVIMDALSTLYRRPQKAAENQRLRYTVEPSALGLVLIAATPEGVCSIEFGETEQALAKRLQERFPQARLIPADRELRGWVSQVLGYIEHPGSLPDIPLDMPGTAFQRQVWKALRAIPCGQTASYSEIAQRIGKPKAYRAVAHAVAGNLLAVVIPCHRAIRADGSLGGYRWGVERKAELLRRESGK